MKRGKQTCKILKDIRRQIAEANDIEFITSECQYQGDCLGTCPKCEAEVRYLEQQLERKRMAGKAITILGISAGLVAMAPMTSCSSSPNKGTNQETISDSTNASVMFGEICPTPVEDTIPMVEKDTESIVAPPPLEAPFSTSGEILTQKEPDSTNMTLVGFVPPTMDEAPSANDTLDVAAVMPEFPGGARELMKFISANIRYPSMSQGGVCQGRAIVQFIVDKEGNIVQPKVVRGVDPYLDKEALRVVGLMPKWKPGELDDGTKVAVRFTIPVMFRLQ